MKHALVVRGDEQPGAMLDRLLSSTPTRTRDGGRIRWLPDQRYSACGIQVEIAQITTTFSAMIRIDHHG